MAVIAVGALWVDDQLVADILRHLRDSGLEAEAEAKCDAWLANRTCVDTADAYIRLAVEVTAAVRPRGIRLLG
jgi:hypothetical protein